MKTRVAIWAAVSSKPQAADDKTSLQDQEDLGRQYAEKIGGEVVKVYKVPGHSRDYIFFQDAADVMPVYHALREDAESGNFDDLWVLDPDRLGRDPALAQQVASLIKKCGLRLWVEDGQYYISTEAGAGGYMFAFQSQRGGEMQKKRADRYASGMRGRIKRGLPPGCWPHGYRPVRDKSGKTIGGEFVPGEIEAVELVTKLFLAGKGYFTIVQHLDASAWRPRRSGHWSFAMIHKMMHNNVYAGYVRCGNAVSTEPSDKYPILWDEATYKEIIREHQRRHRGGSKPASPVSSCVFCNRCGWAMASLKRKGRRYFRCAKHGNYRRTNPCHPNLVRESIIIEKLQEVIAIELQRPGGIDAALEEIGPGRATVEREIKAIEAQIEAIEGKQYRLADLAADHVIDQKAARRRTAELAEQLVAIDKALEDAKKRLATLPDPAEMRQRLERVVQYTDLRSKALEIVRNDLMQAGVRIYVEEHEIVKITFGELF